MKTAQTHRWIYRIGTAGLLVLLQGCAFVSKGIDPDVTACIAENGKVHLMVQNIVTVRGSFHTPFDYGNKSVSRYAYEVVIPLASGKWAAENVEVFAAKRRQEKKSGAVTVTKYDLTFDLYVAERDLPNYSSTPIQGMARGRGEPYLQAAPKCTSSM